jgi:hypothetical protein
MNYSARKIYLTCNETVVREWAVYMQDHIAEVGQALAQEQVRHEAWYAGTDDGGLYVIGVMDVDDHDVSSAVSQKSSLSVDQVHRQFKTHWDRARVTDLPVSRAYEPTFEGCELLLSVRP